jgi:gamma-glutamyltranspeptidase/glutathione hydrolase
MAEAMRRYFADRSEHLGDSDFVKVPLTGLLDPKYIARRRASIDPERATPSSRVKAGTFTGHESVETTHYTVADAAGNLSSFNDRTLFRYRLRLGVTAVIQADQTQRSP